MSFRRSTTSGRRRTVLSVALDAENPRVSYQAMEDEVAPRTSSIFLTSIYITAEPPKKKYTEIVQQLMDDINVDPPRNYKEADARDLPSCDPSFTQEFFSKFNSLMNYREAVNKYEKQFQHEIASLLSAQPTAYEVVSLQRYIIITFTGRWPSLMKA
uniref:Squalene monooxygenase n=1 Tax=Zeugodacus cucurbitae TaxID=28588 RepID=A0A0A1XFH8_ZEUCU